MPLPLPCGGGERRIMLEVRVFKAENNKANRSYYAVTGAKTEAEAINEVIKYKKASKNTFLDFDCRKGYIAPYKDGLDGIWFGLPVCRSQSCHIVWKG